MQLNLERPDYTWFLRGADGQHALVNERILERSFIIAPEALVEDWPVMAWLPRPEVSSYRLTSNPVGRQRCRQLAL